MNKATKLTKITRGWAAGQTLVEMVVATGIVSMVLVAVLAGVALGIRNSRFSKNQALATRYAQEAVEKFRSYRDELGWGPFAEIVDDDGGTITYCLPTLPSDLSSFEGLTDGVCGDEKIPGSQTGTVTEFMRQAEVSLISLGGNEYVEIEVRVWWPEGTRVHESRLNSRLSEWDQ